MPGHPSPTLLTLVQFQHSAPSIPFPTWRPFSFLLELWHPTLGHMTPSTQPWHRSDCERPYLRLWDRNFQEDKGGGDNVVTFKFSGLGNIQNFWTVWSRSFFSMITLAPNPALIPFSPSSYLLIQLKVTIHIHIFLRCEHTHKRKHIQVEAQRHQNEWNLRPLNTHWS